MPPALVLQLNLITVKRFLVAANGDFFQESVLNCFYLMYSFRVLLLVSLRQIWIFF